MTQTQHQSPRHSIAQSDAIDTAPTIWSRLVPRFLIGYPEGLPESEQKTYSIRLLIPVIGAVVHFCLGLLYVIIDVPWMVVVNVVSVAIFALSIILSRSGRHFLGTWIAILEVCVHVPVSTLLLGIDIGYLFFNFTIAICGTVVFPHEKYSRLATSAYAFFSSVALIAWMQFHEPFLQLDLWKNSMLFYLCAVSTFFALIAFSHYFNVITTHAEKKIATELARSDLLLLNVLPVSIADRLKKSNATIADKYDCVTVLFADIVGFTTMCATRDSHEIVVLLNMVFSEFDHIAEKYRLEKIKTIGDCYMVVGGVPELRTDHADSIVRMALEMRNVIQDLREQLDIDLQIRIGIHSGPVIAGVIGERKFAYDLWGDTVNTASRMESHGIPGGIHLSKTTYQLVKDNYILEARGTIAVKGIGKIDTWLVLGRVQINPKVQGAA